MVTEGQGLGISQDQDRVSKENTVLPMVGFRFLLIPGDRRGPSIHVYVQRIKFVRMLWQMDHRRKAHRPVVRVLKVPGRTRSHPQGWRTVKLCDRPWGLAGLRYNQRRANGKRIYRTARWRLLR
jgi:hypothetical protein